MIVKIIKFCIHRIIVSIPVDLTVDAELSKLEERGVKGRYASVERIRELEGGKVEWLMATSSTAGGNIPTFVTENSMASQISAVGFSSFSDLVLMVIWMVYVYRMYLISSSGSTAFAPSQR